MAEISSTGDQMLAVLETVAEEGPLSAAGVARRLDVNRTVAHRLLTTLHRRAYLRRDSQGASGRAILAFAEPRTRKAALGTVEDHSLLSRRLDEAEKLGYTVSHDELQAGVHGLAVPIRREDGHAVASLALVVPSSRADALLQWLEALLAARDEIEKTI